MLKASGQAQTSRKIEVKVGKEERHRQAKASKKKSAGRLRLAELGDKWAGPNKQEDRQRVKKR